MRYIGKVWRSRQGESAGQHGDEHQHRRSGGRSRPRRSARSRSEMLREVFSQTGANSRVLETDGEDMQNREHSCFFSAAHAAKDSGIALELGRSLGLDLPLACATKEQYDRMIAEGLGELDKSGVAELTFKDRHKHSGNRV